MKHGKCAALLAFGLICVSVHAETVRNILPPLYTSSPMNYPSCQTTNACFAYDTCYKTNAQGNFVPGIFYLSAVDQCPTGNECACPSVSNPVKYTTAYDAYPNTGLGPLTATYQRGPLNNSPAAESTFQLTGYQGGMLMRGFDSPYPTAKSKHTAWWYSWADPAQYPGSSCPASNPPQYAQPKLFQLTTDPNDTSDGLVIQSNVTVQQFDAWNISDSKPPHADDIGQVAFVVYLCDQNTHTILQYVIYLYSHNACDRTKYTCAPEGNGAEGFQFDSATNEYFVVTSIERPNIHQLNRYTTTRTDSSGVFSNSTWPYTSPFFRVYITPANLRDTIKDFNSGWGGHFSTDVFQYTLFKVALNSEVGYANNQDTFVFGVSFNGFGVFEIKP
jgi:hypothetical protein